MELEFEVKMNSSVLYDYMLRHSYASLSGLLGGGVGALLVVGFFMTQTVIYLIFGVVVLLYLPWTLFLKAKQQVLRTPAFKEPLHYKMNDDGIEVSQGGVVELQPWETMHKAISTSKSIIVYTTAVNAAIFPRVDLKELTPKVIEMISIHMQPAKVKIRY